MGLEQLKRSIDLKARFDPIRMTNHNMNYNQGSMKPAKKPLMERYRRQKINNYLEELKYLVLSALNKEVSLYTKMEKADILDMAVKYIKAVSPTTPELGTTDYRHDGYVISPLGNHSGNIIYTSNNIPRMRKKTGSQRETMATRQEVTSSNDERVDINNNTICELPQEHQANEVREELCTIEAPTQTPIWRPW